MRLLAIDLGDKRTGLALGDRVTGTASPLAVLEVPLAEREGEALLDRLASVVEDELGPQGTLVLGFPLNMDGSEGPRAKLCRAFGVRIAARTNRAVLLADERRTSARADELMARSGLTHKQKKARRDAIAAAAILQGVLDGTIETYPGAQQSPPATPGEHGPE